VYPFFEMSYVLMVLIPGLVLSELPV